MVRELYFLLCEHHVATILTFWHKCTLFQFWPRIIITNEVLNTVSTEMAVSGGVFHAFQCVAMQTAFLVQGVNN